MNQTKMTSNYLLLLFCMMIFISSVESQRSAMSESSEYVTTLKKITDIMVNDVTSPVAAARYYAYITLTAYEAQSQFMPDKYPSLAKEFKIPLQILVNKNTLNTSDQQHTIIFALLKAAEKLLPSGPSLKEYINAKSSEYTNKSSNPEVIQASVAVADELANQIVKWARTDGFGKLNNLPRYTPKPGPDSWKPTAPAFMAPVEPNWNTIRPFLMDSAQQFKPSLPAPFSTDKNSSFFHQMTETYNVVNNAVKKERDIAMFWDCNPFAVEQIGHIEFGVKKISPGGHWIGIAGIACLKKKFKLEQTVLTHVLLGLTMHDAFIACWDEKYRSDRVRPETAINQLIDPRWRPFLQTPPFPEYVSGHSVVSSASAIVLTAIFGDKFSYTDDTELEFGLPKRKYKSFNNAAAEASISRLYGGIHYHDGIDQGIWQGKQVGGLSLLKLSKYYELFYPK